MAFPVEVVEGPGRDVLDWALAGSSLLAAVAGVVALAYAYKAARAAREATASAKETVRLGRQQADLAAAMVEAEARTITQLQTVAVSIESSVTIALRERAEHAWLRDGDRLGRVLDAALVLMDAAAAYDQTVIWAHRPVMSGRRRLRAALALMPDADLTACRTAVDWPGPVIPENVAKDALDEVQQVVREHSQAGPRANVN